MDGFPIAPTLPGPARAATATRPDHSAPDFDHFNHVPPAARLPAACNVTPIRPGSYARTRTRMASVSQAHAAVHGLARPAVTLGITAPMRPGPAPRPVLGRYPSRSQATSLQPGPAPRGSYSDSDDNADPLRCLDAGDKAIVDVQGGPIWQVRGTSRRSDHVNLTYYARARRRRGRPTSQRDKVSLLGSARRLHTAPTLFGM